LRTLDTLSVFESSVSDGLPTGLEATALLDRLKVIESLIADVRAHYKEVLVQDPTAVPSWFLQPGAIRRSITDPLEAYRCLSHELSPEQFTGCVTVKIGELERLWAKETQSSLSDARKSLAERLKNVLEHKEVAPSLVRTAPSLKQINH
jgi:hypothetical protein